ncbi:MAG: hypothetical protein HYY12_04255 [Candidatus Methylomirabilis oxyfera]|nr:hypothetical protein [Candidatus Methylomirabilis oxyfera]
MVVIWGALIRRGLTYVPGLLLGGNGINRSLLEYSRFPGDRTLCQAYAALLRAIHTDGDQGLLAKAVTLGFRTWLMGRTTGDSPLHNQELLSLRGNLAYIRERPRDLQRQWSEMIESALVVGLGESNSRPKIDPRMVLAFLQWVRGIIRFSLVPWASFHYVVLQVRHGRSFIGPHRFLSKYVTLAHSLAEACLWNEGVPIHSEIMRGIEDLVGAPCPSQGRPDHEARIIDEMIALARVHTCRIVVPGGRLAVGARSHS